ncbi:MAG: hypothetical protein EBZ50_11390, partial [Alphaproteobacteria bacterium]|nr:hypothetical protein [Alphaproteobacteria bacterium]
MNDALGSLWANARAVCAHLDDEAALRHCWAVAASDPLRIASLYSSVRLAGQTNLIALANRLADMVAELIGAEPIAAALVKSEWSVADLSGSSRLSPGLRVRYALAHRLRANVTARELTAAAACIDVASSYVQRRELLRLLRRADEKAIQIRRFGLIEFLMRPNPEQSLVLSSTVLAGRWAPRGLPHGQDLDVWLEVQRTARDEADAAGAVAVEALAARDFDAVGSALADLTFDRLTKAALARHQVGRAIAGRLAGAAASSSARAWQAIWPDIERLLIEGWPRVRIPPYWSLGPDEIADALCAGRLQPKAILTQDLALLRTSWSLAAQERLLRAKADAALDLNAAVWTALSLNDVDALTEH